MIRVIHPGSRGQKGTGSRIRIRNTAFNPLCYEQYLGVLFLVEEGEEDARQPGVAVGHDPLQAVGVLNAQARARRHNLTNLTQWMDGLNVRSEYSPQYQEQNIRENQA
jgi:hypothetical protein